MLIAQFLYDSVQIELPNLYDIKDDRINYFMVFSCGRLMPLSKQDAAQTAVSRISGW